MAEAPQAGLDRRVIFALAIVYVVWGSTYLAIRFAVREIPAFLGAGARFFVAGAALAALGRLRGAPWPTRLELRNGAVVGLLLLCIGNGAVNVAEETVDSGMAALLVATMPLWMAAMDAFRPGGVRPTVGTVLGLLCGFVGIVVLVGRPSSGSIDLRGVVLLNIATISWAAGSLFARHAQLPRDFLMRSGVEMLLGGIALLVLAVAQGDLGRLAAHPPGARAVWALVYLVVFGSWIGYSAFSWLLKNAAPTIVGTYAYVNPVVAVFLGWLLAGEPIGLRVLVGAGIVVAAVALVTATRRAA